MNFSMQYRSPFGVLSLFANEHALERIAFGQETSEKNANPVLTEVKNQLDEYFEGKRTRFELPLQPKGTAFQHLVWKQLQTIPMGQTCAYSELAQQIGRDQAARAVGLANNRNPIPIVIPCHRVIGKHGDLVGYAGGLDMKRKLLEFESLLVS